jgi:hypothetical protein
MYTEQTVAGTMPFSPPRGAEACRAHIAWSLHTKLHTKAALRKSMTANTQPLYNPIIKLGNGGITRKVRWKEVWPYALCTVRVKHPAANFPYGSFAHVIAVDWRFGAMLYVIKFIYLCSLFVLCSNSFLSPLQNLNSRSDILLFVQDS